MFKALCLTLAMYGIPTAIFFATAERAETTGYTELSRVTGIGGQHPGDNYAVFRKARQIYIITGLAPARIMERDGKLVRTNTVMFKTLPVRTYSPATPAEEALWRRHFS